MSVLKRGVAVILLLMMLTGIFSGCDFHEDNVYQSLEDFERARIGVMTGSSHELIAKKRFPNAKLVYFSNPSDLVLAVEQGKIDCYMLGSPFLASVLWENANVKRIDEAIDQGDIAFAFPKNTSSDTLREQLNAFLSNARSDGTIDRLKDKWFGETEPTEHPDYKSLTGENGTIRLAVVAGNKPMIYKYKNQCTGLEMDILTAFAQEYGYRFEVDTVPFDSVIMGMATGKYDMTSASLHVTPERAESVNFSDPYMQFDVVLVVKGDGKTEPAAMTLNDVANGTVGLVVGTNWDVVAQREFPNAKRKYFSSAADTMLALEQDKIDAFFADKTVYAGMKWENKNLDCIDEPIESVSNALILAKNGYDEELLDRLNAFIAKAKSDGTLDALSEKWFGDNEPTEHPDYRSLTGENGTLKVAVGDSMKPTAYQRGTMCTGYEVDFLTLFAEEYGYKLEVEGMAFEALIPSVSSGKFDIGACGITITPERAESVTFTDPHFETYGVAVIRSETEIKGNLATLDGFENAVIGVLTGSSYESIAKERFPNATRKYYPIMSDLIFAVEQGKIDGFISEKAYYNAALREGAQISVIDDPLATTDIGFIFQKDEDSLVFAQMNEFIGEAKNSGLLDQLYEKWFGSDEPSEHPDYTSLSGENGTVRVAVSPDFNPVAYYKDGEITGYEIDLLVRFATEYGYGLELLPMTFEAVLPGVTTGKYDIGCGGFNNTEERRQNVDFSDAHLEEDIVMVISSEVSSSTRSSFWDRIKEGFEKTFIREDRWQLIAEGIGVTVFISVAAAIAGTLLGLGLYMLGRSDIRLIQVLTKGVAKVYSRIIAGTPVVVILMILFYVVFGRVRDMNGIWVAIIGFTLTFGAFVYEHMTVSVGSIDPGQTEAAYSLGYTKNKAFFRIVFPQAMKIFMPSYCGHAVELVKATAIVGYIAVNDLTKMGDIIRSNTYEAFFPLISTAVIYFLLTWILSLLLGLVRSRFEPKRRSNDDILKGVKTV